MKHIDFLQLNKFSSLHNNHTIFFCKTDYILNDFRFISTLDHEVVLITGNSDYPITDDIVVKAPLNIKKWFAQNAVSNNALLEPLPIGLENKIECNRNGHGIGYYDRMITKEKLLSRNITHIKPDKIIYANFNIATNPPYRLSTKNICLQNIDINWQDYTLTLEQWFDSILEHKMTVCPIGNGLDTHRLWEVLYADRIPVTIKTGNFKLYELYKQFPIIVLDNINDLKNTELILSEYDKIQNTNYDSNLLSSEYWKSKILSYV